VQALMVDPTLKDFFLFKMQLFIKKDFPVLYFPTTVAIPRGLSLGSSLKKLAASSLIVKL